MAPISPAKRCIIASNRWGRWCRWWTGVFGDFEKSIDFFVVAVMKSIDYEAFTTNSWTQKGIFQKKEHPSWDDWKEHIMRFNSTNFFVTSFILCLWGHPSQFETVGLTKMGVAIASILSRWYICFTLQSHKLCSNTIIPLMSPKNEVFCHYLTVDGRNPEPFKLGIFFKDAPSQDASERWRWRFIGISNPSLPNTSREGGRIRYVFLDPKYLLTKCFGNLGKPKHIPKNIHVILVVMDWHPKFMSNKKVRPSQKNAGGSS